MTIEAGTEEEATTERVVYTEAQKALISNKIRALRASGNPQPAFIMRDKMRAGIFIQPHEYGEDVVNPEKTTEGVDPAKLVIPKRNGTGSRTKDWAAFAKITLEMDAAVIDKMSRADLIALLEEQGVIQSEQSEEE